MFGENLKRIRESLGLTQTELAQQLGTTKQSINRYEKNLREPNIRTVSEFAAALMVPVEELTGEYILNPWSSKNLIRIRQQFGLTSDQVAKHIGISPDLYKKYEDETAEPSISVLVRLSKFFFVDTDFILDLVFPIVNDDEIVVGNDRFSHDEQELIHCYRKASSDDRDIVNLTLKKYSEKATASKEEAV